ncbi:DUF3560 domain-containing protein [Iningainema tapete]|uniref:DUF3560 domain-containing protein n=1 Tax=Iningainema tapete BLCC-T55 TaxID=2748662 RepID=A0A8J6XL25_9CYAN|nr:DUF3560 domain-containing protein [Iningainema tapete]MBD2778254.1 DUF3560 domain-containing protein [Iningainema tapete BLCC-T55]
MSEQQEKQFTLASVGIKIVESQTKPTKPGKKPIPVWNILGNTKPYEHIIYDLSVKVKKWHGTLSCFEDPTEELVERIQSEGALSFKEQLEVKQERAAQRADRLDKRADKHEKIADTAYKTQKQIADSIPLGQPILIGHHSERRHRRDLATIHRNMRSYIDESNYAKHLRERAELNREKASGEYNLTYLGNRLEEAKTNLRGVIADIEGTSSRSGFKKAEGKQLERLLLLKTQYEEQVQTWQELIDVSGGIQYSKDNVKKGDWVLYRGVWYQVYRANTKTVTLHFFYHDQCWSNPGEYYELRGHVPKDKALAYAQEKYGVDLSCCHSTQINLSKALIS